MMTNHIAFYRFCSAVRRKGALVLCLTLCTLGLGFAQDPKPTIITFDVPGAGPGAGGLNGTFPVDINPAGVITGWYGVNPGINGFVRDRDGNFTPIPLPVIPYGINARGVITGAYVTFSATVPDDHGFVRDPDGTFTTFDVTGAASGQVCGTIPVSINEAGTISGYWCDSDYVYHGFVRDKDGWIRSFDAPHAGTKSGQGTFPNDPDGINPAGTISGYLVDAAGVEHGFVRDRDGRITEYDAPHAGTESGQGTYGVAINPAGMITGAYLDKNYVYHGFVRDPDGRITEFDGPDAGTLPYQGTGGSGINPSGVITGNCMHQNGVDHGIVRYPDGRIIEFDAHEASNGEAIFYTVGQSINPAGEITGYALDVSGFFHGFLLIP
jgi:hypothetical protein